MPGVQGSVPLKHDPTVDLITAKPNKQKSISAGKVKEEKKKERKLDQNDRGWWLQLWVQERGGAKEVYMPRVFVHCPNKLTNSER